LWPEIQRIVVEVRPSFVFLENVALPQCSRCEAPAANEGDLCEECTTRAIRTEREEAGWRREIHLSVPALERGDVETVRRGIRAFERKREKHLPGGTQ
jgi:hypothetical protein